MEIKKILDEQRKLLRPDKKGLEEIELFVKLINKGLKASKIKATATLGGSVAKGTFLREAHDADIFVKFDPSFGNKNISAMLEQVLKKLKLKYEKVHGSRDYFQIKKSILFEIVPVLNVNDYRQAMNVADMSPLHVDYFIKKAKKETRDEVRLTKQFLKSARIYGAESYIKGFSGHVVDLLIINYGSFLELVKKASKWKDEVIIDVEKHHLNAKMSINTSKTAGPLLIVDPVQKTRNAAAAITKESFDIFRKKCKEFLKNPSDEFFTVPDFNDIIDEKANALKKDDFFILNVKTLKGKKDVVGSKILKIKEYIEKISAEIGFKLTWSDWEFNEINSRIVLAFDSKKLSEKIEIKGPPIDMKKHVESFKKKHKKTYAKKEFIYAEEKRKYVRAEKFLEAVIKDKYVLEKCKGINFSKLQKVF